MQINTRNNFNNKVGTTYKNENNNNNNIDIKLRKTKTAPQLLCVPIEKTLYR